MLHLIKKRIHFTKKKKKQQNPDKVWKSQQMLCLFMSRYFGHRMSDVIRETREAIFTKSWASRYPVLQKVNMKLFKKCFFFFLLVGFEKQKNTRLIDKPCKVAGTPEVSSLKSHKCIF